MLIPDWLQQQLIYYKIQAVNKYGGSGLSGSDTTRRRKRVKLFLLYRFMVSLTKF